MLRSWGNDNSAGARLFPEGFCRISYEVPVLYARGISLSIFGAWPFCILQSLAPARGINKSSEIDFMAALVRVRGRS
jgi:hypothetical protein